MVPRTGSASTTKNSYPGLFQLVVEYPCFYALFECNIRDVGIALRTRLLMIRSIKSRLYAPRNRHSEVSGKDAFVAITGSTTGEMSDLRFLIPADTHLFDTASGSLDNFDFKFVDDEFLAYFRYLLGMIHDP